jgi:hypothetical protein
VADNTTVADLVAAEIPWADGMCDSRGDRVEIGADGEAFTYCSWGSRQEPLYPPNPADRATFLLLVDEAYRRDVEWCYVERVGHRLPTIAAPAVWDGRSAQVLGGPTREGAIAALARALREARRG